MFKPMILLKTVFNCVIIVSYYYQFRGVLGISSYGWSCEAKTLKTLIIKGKRGGI